MSYTEEYNHKKISSEEAAKLVQSGDWIDYGWCVGQSYEFDRALAKRYQELQNVNVRGGVSLWMPEIFKIANPKEHFTWNSWHFSGNCRKITEMGCGYYIPMRYAEIPRLYRENVDPIQVAAFQVAPMDEHGYFNFGPQASHQMAVIERSKFVVVEVNTNMPQCMGGIETAVHISKVSHIIEGSNPVLAQLPSAIPSDVDRKVAKLIVEEIPNGACLQLGIGGMPNAVGIMIADSDLKDLGVHTEMYVDAFVEMSLKGKINGSKKSIDRGRQTFAFGAGTDKLYKFIHNNPEVMSTTVEYTNDPSVVGQLDNFVSINNAVEIDLFGQINAESSGSKQISGTGGQLDFVMGAYKSKGGKSFVCLASTYGKTGETKSRIVPTLERGSITTDSRTVVHWVVTEYGKVNLKGKSTWQRAEAIISIANPLFQDNLIREAESLKIWKKSNR
ncbi:MAG TPA: butyryl-CoA:acetate CoA-transferase [Leptospiraceae bacterium]|nr:butyryl-CoA:acetate CoA-transferase [Leptospiraceae bacterium]HRG75563.1 butyryl-CoA:acetate CoA-transferase [Leptospiraceae bacterium]